MMTALPLIPSVVEEALRYASPNQGMFRICREDSMLGGVMVPKGATLWVMFGSANRDESAWTDPDVFNPDRTDMSRHVAFGKGIYVCLAAALARLEARVVVEVLTLRLASVSLVPGAPLRYAPSGILRGLERLDVRVTYR